MTIKMISQPGSATSGIYAKTPMMEDQTLSLLELPAYLDCGFPGSSLMPTTPTGKVPLHPHKNGQYTSEDFKTTGYKECRIGCMIILTGDLIVVDVDDYSYCDTFENSEPTFAQTVCCKTSKGKHYYFHSTPQSIAAKNERRRAPNDHGHE